MAGSPRTGPSDFFGDFFAMTSEERCYFAIVGGSGAGKSSVLRELRAQVKPGELKFLPRFVTRRSRPEDQPFETIGLRHDEYRGLKDAGCFAYEWWRQLTDRERQYYSIPISRQIAPVIFCGNLELVDRVGKTGFPPGHLTTIGISASVETRIERIRKRSPDLESQASEFRVRSSAVSDSISKNVDFWVDNNGRDVADAVQDVLRVIASQMGGGHGGC
jgi:ribose 1,5-bisphosphokinase PhnN